MVDAALNLAMQNHDTDGKQDDASNSVEPQ